MKRTAALVVGLLVAIIGALAATAAGSNPLSATSQTVAYAYNCQANFAIPTSTPIDLGHRVANTPYSAAAPTPLDRSGLPRAIAASTLGGASGYERLVPGVRMIHATASVAGPRVITDPSALAGGRVAANTPARFAVNGAGEATLHLRLGSGSLEVTEHAAKRLTMRNISIDAAENTLKQRPFQYFHDDVSKTGDYDPASRVFLGSVQGRVTTVIDNVKPGYISNLQAVTP